MDIFAQKLESLKRMPGDNTEAIEHCITLMNTLSRASGYTSRKRDSDLKHIADDVTLAGSFNWYIGQVKQDCLIL